MSGYFGTQIQQRLQAQAEASTAYINATPGACQAGRTMGCDDPDQLGWDRINAFLTRDGVCGFRLISAPKAEEIRSQLIKQDCRFDTWEVFTADRATALAACEALPMCCGQNVAVTIANYYRSRRTKRAGQQRARERNDAGCRHKRLNLLGVFAVRVGWPSHPNQSIR